MHCTVLQSTVEYCWSEREKPPDPWCKLFYRSFHDFCTVISPVSNTDPIYKDPLLVGCLRNIKFLIDFCDERLTAQKPRFCKIPELSTFKTVPCYCRRHTHMKNIPPSHPAADGTTKAQWIGCLRTTFIYEKHSPESPRYRRYHESSRNLGRNFWETPNLSNKICKLIKLSRRSAVGLGH